MVTETATTGSQHSQGGGALSPLGEVLTETGGPAQQASEQRPPCSWPNSCLQASLPCKPGRAPAWGCVHGHFHAPRRITLVKALRASTFAWAEVLTETPA